MVIMVVNSFIWGAFVFVLTSSFFVIVLLTFHVCRRNSILLSQETSILDFFLFFLVRDSNIIEIALLH